MMYQVTDFLAYILIYRWGTSSNFSLSIKLSTALHFLGEFVNHRQTLDDFSSPKAPSVFCAISLLFDMEKP
jgi:hypothetical protein